MQNNSHHYNYRRVLTILLGVVLLNIVLLALLYYMVTNRPKPDYFAVTSDGKVIRLYALSEPLVTSSELLQWTTIVATSVNTYNFVNWRKELQDASHYFTATGWSEFQDALKTSNNLETVTSKKLSVSAVATGAPVILDRGLIGGVYKWKVQVPLLITYESASANLSQSVVATILVTRVSTLTTSKGIAIDAFYMSEQSLGAPGQG